MQTNVIIAVRFHRLHPKIVNLKNIKIYRR